MEDGCANFWIEAIKQLFFTGCPLMSASTEPEVWDEISNGRPLSKLDMNFSQYFQK
jgi:hypothetical protein